MNQDRLQTEAQEMRRLFPAFSLWQDDGGQYYWEGTIQGRRFKVQYTSLYPHVAPDVYDEPPLATHHRYGGGRLCLLRSEEWSSDFTAATMVGEIFRFLHEHQQGLTG